MKALVQALEQARRARGWTVSELARRAGISRNVAYKVLRGESETSWDNLQAMSDAQGVSMFALMDTTEDQFNKDREALRKLLEKMDAGEWDGERVIVLDKLKEDEEAE